MMNRRAHALYVSQYNSFNARKADLLALGGKYDQALKILKLMKRFEKCDLTQNEILDRRIGLIEKLSKKQLLETSLRTLKEMTTDHGPSVFEILETKKSILRTNLFEVTFEPWDELE